MTQGELGKAAGYSQQNITWLEAGKMKRPQRAASALATALQTTTEYLLSGTGPARIGPRFLPPDQLKQKYEALSPDQKAIISQQIEEATSESSPRRTG